MENTDLGKLITGEGERDAIHIAVVPLIAGCSLAPGEKIRLKVHTKNVALAITRIEQAIGVVDPFLPRYYIQAGDKFYGLLYPGTITGLKHHWHHPVFDAEITGPANEHEEWIRAFCDEWNFDYDSLIKEAQGTDGYHYITAQGIDLHSRQELGSDHDDFWYHLEQLTKKHFDNDHRENFIWSCSC